MCSSGEGIAPQLVLASGSPRRRELLLGLGLTLHVRAADIDETPLANESPRDLVARLARRKASAVHARLRAESAGLELPVLGADTIVVMDGDVLGKPRDRDEALGMLDRLSGSTHEVLTGVALVHDTVQVAVSRSQVRFRTIDAAEAEAYWATGEPCDKAGAYGIQGIGGIFVASLDGSYSGVMGLPVAETETLLLKAGVDVWRHRVPPR